MLGHVVLCLRTDSWMHRLLVGTGLGCQHVPWMYPVSTATAAVAVDVRMLKRYWWCCNCRHFPINTTAARKKISRRIQILGPWTMWHSNRFSCSKKIIITKKTQRHCRIIRNVPLVESRNAVSNLTDGDLVSQLMVSLNESNESMDQFWLVAAEFELWTRSDVFVQTFDKCL